MLKLGTPLKKKKKKMSSGKTLRSLSSLLGSPSKGPPPAKRALFQDADDRETSQIANLAQLYELLSEDRRLQTEQLASSIDRLSSRLDKFENTLESTVSRVNAVEASTSKSGKDITTVQAQTKALETTVMELRKEMADLRASHRDAIADVARKQDVAERMANIIAP